MTGGGAARVARRYAQAEARRRRTGAARSVRDPGREAHQVGRRVGRHRLRPPSGTHSSHGSSTRVIEGVVDRDRERRREPHGAPRRVVHRGAAERREPGRGAVRAPSRQLHRGEHRTRGAEVGRPRAARGVVPLGLNSLVTSDGRGDRPGLPAPVLLCRSEWIERIVDREGGPVGERHRGRIPPSVAESRPYRGSGRAAVGRRRRCRARRRRCGRRPCPRRRRPVRRSLRRTYERERDVKEPSQLTTRPFGRPHAGNGKREAKS